ncbi:MAG: hypothetical protein DRH49_05575 [Candidatus Coatesbacteria bacterium]|nr:MAG: hypothetical protein DRH49_05575 [Candidatus Coatesbacteria bacterium]
MLKEISITITMLFVLLSSFAHSSDTITAGDLFRLTVKEGDTIDLIELIRTESYLMYGGFIKVRNCSVRDNILTISNEGYNGYIEVGRGDGRWHRYEIFGRFQLPPIPCESYDKKLFCFDIAVHCNYNAENRDKMGSDIIRIFPEKEILLIDYSEESDKPKKVRRKKTRVLTGVWYDFRVVVKGSSVKVYIDDKKSVNSKWLSNDSGGFKLYPLSFRDGVYKVSFKELKVKVVEWKEDG